MEPNRSFGQYGYMTSYETAETSKQPISPEEFARAFDHYSRSIYNHCFRETADWAEAEDLTSIVFLETWRRRATVDLSIDNAKPWLFGVAINVLRHRRRSLRRHASAMSRLPIAHTTPDFADDLAERVDYQEQVMTLQRVIAGMSRKHREILALCEWSDLSTSEAAKALDISLGTAKSRLSRARQQARDALTIAQQGRVPQSQEKTEAAR